MTVLQNVLARLPRTDRVASARQRAHHAAAAARGGAATAASHGSCSISSASRATVDALANSLPFGHQRLVEIARALAMEPMLIAMDEPAAGLNPKEVEELDQPDHAHQRCGASPCCWSSITWTW